MVPFVLVPCGEGNLQYDGLVGGLYILPFGHFCSSERKQEDPVFIGIFSVDPLLVFDLGQGTSFFIWDGDLLLGGGKVFKAKVIVGGDEHIAWRCLGDSDPFLDDLYLVGPVLCVIDI